MKKLFTFLIVLGLATTLLALPKTKLPQLKQTNASAEQIKTTTQNALVQKAICNPTKRVARPVQLQQNTPFPAQAKHLVQSATKAQSITLDGGVFLVEPEYELEAGEWYIAVQSGNFTFRLCWYGNADTYCGTYTMDDISIDYTWGWFQSEDMFYEIYLTDVNMTLSEQQVGDCLKQIILEATLVDTNDQTYELHVVHNAYTPKSTVDALIENTTLNIFDEQFVLDGNNQELDILLTVNALEVGGFYTLDNLDLENTKILCNGVEQQLLKADLFLQMAMFDDGAIGYYVDFSFFNQDTILYNVSMNAPLPPAKDTIQVECKNLVVDESFGAYGIIMVMGDNADYDIFVMYEGEYAEPGVYENVSVNITDKSTWLTEASVFATLTLSENTDGWHANIETYCTDYNWYSIDMKYEVPVPTDTVKIAFDQSAIASYKPYESNMIQLLNYGEDYEASVTVYGVELGQEFTMNNVLLDYSGIYDWSVESTVRIADVKGVLNQHGDTTTITASIIGFNAIQYDVELWYTAPVPTDTIYIEMPVEFVNAMDFGYYTLSSYTPDSTWFISLSPVTDQVAGTFINDGVFGKFGADGGRYDFLGGSTFIYSEKEWKNYTVEKGSLVVELEADGTINAEAQIICSNKKFFHIKMTSEYNTHLDYDEPYTEVDRIYTVEDYVTIDDQTANYGYIYLALEAADQSDMAAFFFFVEETDDDIIIPEGVYPINYTEDYGTVYANPGIQGDGVWPSFYAQLLEDGSLVVPLWLLVDGTVEVTKDDAGQPYMEVNAVNSYGVAVHIVFDGRATALEDIPSASPQIRKQIVNGQFVIMNNGETYNATGARIK